MASSWSAVSWQPSEVITDDKMNQDSSNVQWVKDNTPRATWNGPDGGRRAQGVVIVGGIAIVTPRAANFAGVQINFGASFGTGCKPVITTGIVNNFQTKVFCRVVGIGRTQPDHNGFEARVQVSANDKENDKIADNIYVHYMAMGYK